MKHVLVMRLSAMGDVAMMSPVLSTACRKYPDVQFDVLTTTFYEPFFEKLDNLHFIGTDIKKRHGGLRSLIALFWRLRKKTKYNAVIDLNDVLRTMLLRFFFALTGKKTYRMIKGRKSKKQLVAFNNKRFVQLKPTIECYAEAFARAGFPIDEPNTFLPREPIPVIENLPQQKSGKWIGVAPFAQHKGKIYPLERMIKVVEQLCNTEGYSVFIFGGGKKEVAVADEWAAKFDNCYSVIGKVKLADEMALMSNLDCMLSMDSAAMHIASLYGVRVVSVWGATHHYAGFLGYRQSVDDIMQVNIPCRPCSIYGNKPCAFDDYCCFNIDPQKIVNKIIGNTDK